MKLIVGLGNPGYQYERTRHNVGFMAIDTLTKSLEINLNQTKFNGIFVKTQFEDKDVIIAKPTTYMNLSGEFIRDIKKFYKIKDEDILIIYDELDLNVGEIKIKSIGSANGHNGIKSISSCLSNNETQRLKIGIGRPQNSQGVANYVLGNFNNEEINKINLALEKIVSICIDFVDNSYKYIQNKYNDKRKK